MLNVPASNPQSPNKKNRNMIIAYLGRSVKDYRENFLRYLASLDIRCPVCGGKAVFHDSYDRHVHIVETVEWIIVQRVICNGCGKTHAILPDFIKPRKHYSTFDIEISLRDMEDGVTPENVETEASISTLKRWKKEFKKKSHQAAGALRGLLYRLFEKTVNEFKLAELKIFEMLEKILEEFPEIESGNLVIGDTNIWLSNNIAGMIV